MFFCIYYKSALTLQRFFTSFLHYSPIGFSFKFQKCGFKKCKLICYSWLSIFYRLYYITNEGMRQNLLYTSWWNRWVQFKECSALFHVCNAMSRLTDNKSSFAVWFCMLCHTRRLAKKYMWSVLSNSIQSRENHSCWKCCFLQRSPVFFMHDLQMSVFVTNFELREFLIHTNDVEHRILSSSHYRVS